MTLDINVVLVERPGATRHRIFVTFRARRVVEEGPETRVRGEFTTEHGLPLSKPGELMGRQVRQWITELRRGFDHLHRRTDHDMGEPHPAEHHSTRTHSPSFHLLTDR